LGENMPSMKKEKKKNQTWYEKKIKEN